MEKECTLSIGKMPLGCLPRKSVVRITDRLDMTSAVYTGCKATNQTTVMIQSFRTDRSGQTVQTQIRLLLEEQSD